MLVEKGLPHYDLGSIKATFATVLALRMTKSALTTSEALGLTLAAVVALIQGMSRAQFYKSMTSVGDHRIWQDVYHVPHADRVLYVKFTTDAEGYLVISLKEK